MKKYLMIFLMAFISHLSYGQISASIIRYLRVYDSLKLGNNTIVAFDKDTTLSANSDSVVATQKAIKNYIDNHGSNLSTSPLTATGDYVHNWANHNFDIQAVQNFNIGGYDEFAGSSNSNSYNGYKNYLIGTSNQVITTASENYIIGRNNTANSYRVTNDGASTFTYMLGDKNVSWGEDCRYLHLFGHENKIGGDYNQYNFAFGNRAEMQDNNKYSMLFEMKGKIGSRLFNGNVESSAFGVLNSLQNGVRSFMVGYNNQVYNPQFCYGFGANNLFSADEDFTRNYSKELMAIGHKNVFSGNQNFSYIYGRDNSTSVNNGNNIQLFGLANHVNSSNTASHIFLFGDNNQYDESYGDVGEFSMAFGRKNVVSGVHSLAFGEKQVPQPGQMRVGSSIYDYLSFNSVGTGSPGGITAYTRYFYYSSDLGGYSLSFWPTYNFTATRTQYGADANGTPCFSVNTNTADVQGNINVDKVLSTINSTINLTGGTWSPAVGKYNILNPNNTITSMTLTLPSSSLVDNQFIELKFVKPATSITAGTLCCGVTVANLPTSATAGQYFKFVYNASLNKWF